MSWPLGAGRCPKVQLYSWEEVAEIDAQRRNNFLCCSCEGFKAPRAHHCRKCERCVLKMDHHCPWINNCVGHFNHGHFTGSFYVRFLCVNFFIIPDPNLEGLDPDRQPCYWAINLGYHIYIQYSMLCFVILQPFWPRQCAAAASPASLSPAPSTTASTGPTTSTTAMEQSPASSSPSGLCWPHSSVGT